jgi:hypothetical protein
MPLSNTVKDGITLSGKNLVIDLSISKDALLNLGSALVSFSGKGNKGDIINEINTLVASGMWKPTKAGREFQEFYESLFSAKKASSGKKVSSGKKTSSGKKASSGSSGSRSVSTVTLIDDVDQPVAADAAAPKARKPRTARKKIVKECGEGKERNELTNRCRKSRNNVSEKCWTSKVLKYKRDPPCDTDHVQRKSPYGRECCYTPRRSKSKKTPLNTHVRYNSRGNVWRG